MLQIILQIITVKLVVITDLLNGMKILNFCSDFKSASLIYGYDCLITLMNISAFQNLAYH